MRSGDKVKRIAWDNIPPYIALDMEEEVPTIHEGGRKLWWFPTQKDILAQDWIKVDVPEFFSKPEDPAK